jgi:hypothetical protein
MISDFLPLVIKLIVVYHLVLSLNLKQISSDCPPYDLLNPCYCHWKVSQTYKLQYCGQNRSESSHECQVPVITCTGNQSMNLSKIFSKVSHYLRDEKRKPFEWLYLANTAISQLDANLLSGLQFKNIYIRQCVNLTTINMFAFNNSAQFVKHIWINATKLSDRISHKKSFFKAINSLNNLRTFEIIGSRFTSIPSKAFNRNSSVRSISFHNYNERQFLKKINTKAFYKLSNLRQIDLRNNRISKINSYAFQFDTYSNHTLRIHLENNYLKSDSFSANAFLGGKGRRIVLYLGGYRECNENLKSLDKAIFEPFLLENRKNIIELYGCPIECDQNVLWLNKHKNLLVKRVKNLVCLPNIVLSKVEFNKITYNTTESFEKTRIRKKNRINPKINF